MSNIINKYKVGIFIRSLQLGGAEKQSVLLTKYLSRYYSTILFVFYDSQEDYYNISEWKNVIILKGNILSKLFNLFKYLRNNKIVFMFNFLPINNVIGAIIGRLAGVKHIYGGIRGSAHKSMPKMLVQKIICNYFVKAFISNSYEAKKNYIKYGFKANKIFVIHNAIEFVSSDKLSNDDAMTILSVGRFVEEKDYFTSIRTIEYLLNHYNYKKKIRYKIVGYGKLEGEITRFIAEKKLNHVVQLAPSDNTQQLYKSSDIFLNTSVNEGMPNVIMEAMAYSLPIVSTEAGDIKYLVKNNYNGFLCNKKKFKDLAYYLDKLISDNDLRKIMGNRSRKIIDNKYTPDVQYINYRKIIDGLG